MKNNSLLKDEVPFTQFPSLYSVAPHLVPVHPVGLDGLLAEFVPVHAGGAAVVLLLGVRRLAVVRPEE